VRQARHIRRLSLLGAFALLALTASATAQLVSREQDIVDLRLGQRILVDDGSCPAGQIKEVAGAKMTAAGIQRAKNCIPRLGPKKR
jgi:uncharacterized protein DUF6719